jgi:ATP/maltotriose-dependent transcriptional regulator MalT
MTVRSATGAGGVPLRVAAMPVALPWENGIVLASAPRSDFPTASETHLLRVAVSQAAIAIHTGRRLAQERAARTAAEEEVRLQRTLLSTLLTDVGPPLEHAAQRIREAERALREPPTTGHALADHGADSAGATAPSDRAHPAALPLTRREAEVLGLLAQGLSNKEIAGVLWLSDRTVERHITGLYRKIGVARRSEATAFALRHGMG